MYITSNDWIIPNADIAYNGTIKRILYTKRTTSCGPDFYFPQVLSTASIMAALTPPFSMASTPLIVVPPGEHT